jgi:CRP-like cAMP-binding protein
MDVTRSFYEFLKKFVDLTQDEYNRYIKPYTKIRKFNKREIITHQGEVEQYYNFVLCGLVRKYYIKEEEEINAQISCENQFIHAQVSFHTRTPSEYFIETIEPSTLLSITYDDLEAIYFSHPKMERLGRLITTFLMVLQDRLQQLRVKFSPRERFLLFVDKNPHLLQRVPQKQLASYLNIKPETFSRFKHMLKEKRVVQK